MKVRWGNEITNWLLVNDPNDEDALLQIADIQYRKGEINKAWKAIDFLNSKKNNEDPLWLYIKGILEMEKNNWKEARSYLQKALVLTNAENHEIIRCYGLCNIGIEIEKMNKFFGRFIFFTQ